MNENQNTPQPYKFHHVIALSLVFFSFFMSAFISRTVFDRLPHLEDEMAYVYQARVFAGGNVVIDRPEPWTAFWQPFVIGYAETGNAFSKYTPGWSLILAIGVMFGQMWVINAFLAGLTVALIYRLGSEVFSPDVGMIAAGLVAFSPMALLLNASLMGHTSALFMVTVFMFAYWRLSLGKRALLWGTIAGFALGMTLMTRALTAIGIATPFVIWSIWRLLATLRNREAHLAFIPTLRPLIALSIVTILLGMAIPLYNNATTGDPTTNLYTLVWSYDRVGFGSCCGRSSLPDREGNGHDMVRGIRHTRFDLSLTAADLFGWTIGEVDERVQFHLQTQSNYFPLLGLSWLLLPLGLFVGFKRRWLTIWLAVAIVLLVTPLIVDAPFLKDNNTLIWGWVLSLGVWMLIPPFVFAFSEEHDRVPVWTWLLLGTIVGLIGVHLAYWIGSQRYSTRYYFETLPAFALISAIPIAWIIRRYGAQVRYWVFAIVLAVMLSSLLTYSTPRINALEGFNFISQAQIDAVNARRTSESPALVIVNFTPIGGDDRIRWRSYGSLMAVTSPQLDSDIIAARNYSNGVRDTLIAQFPDHEVIDLYVNGNQAWFADELAQLEE